MAAESRSAGRPSSGTSKGTAASPASPQAPGGIPSPQEFFSHLKWLDGRPLLDVIEPYRSRIFDQALYSFRADETPLYNLVLSGRAKKNWKSADLVLAALYRFLVWRSPHGNDCFLLGNDADQADDDLKIVKKMIEANTILSREVTVRAKDVVRQDGRGVLQILPAQDVKGSHGKSYLFCGFDEIHAYRNWDLFEALAPDPTRPDAMMWITSYASIFNTPGAPLHDMIKAGKAGADPRMLFSWYAGDYCTDSTFADLPTSELRANPSIGSWAEGGAYLEQQQRRLPSHKYRRLHLNLPGAPDGAFFDGANIQRCIVAGRRRLPPLPNVEYCGFVDMSGGSSDDSCLAISHKNGDRLVLDLVMNQGRRPPFNPRHAIKKFVGVLQEYGVRRVTGDRYAGETFRQDFQDLGITYHTCRVTRSDLYEALEPAVNAAEVELLDLPKLQEQLLTLVMRGSKVDHQSGDHDDWSNAAAGAIWMIRPRVQSEPRIRSLDNLADVAPAVSGVLSDAYSGGRFDEWARRG